MTKDTATASGADATGRRNRLLIGTALLLVVIALASLMYVYRTKALFYDEPWYLSTVGLIHQFGLSPGFLRELPGPAGPLYTLVHFVAEPITGLTPPLVRLVNPALLIACVAITWALVRSTSNRGPIIASLSIVAVPIAWKSIGLALTEIPAMTAFAGFALAVAVLYSRRTRTTYDYPIAVAGGLALGFAVLGRQPLLACVAPLALLPMFRKEFAGFFAVMVFCMLLVTFPVFHTWGGIVPPLTKFVGDGFRITHALECLGYTSILFALLCPDWYRGSLKIAAFGAAAALLANVALGLGEMPAFDSLAKRWLPASALPLYGRAVFGALLGLGVGFAVASFRQLWVRRLDGLFVFALGCVGTQVVAAAKVTHLFSSRYLVPILPIMVWISDAYERPSAGRALRLLIGGSMGFASLYGFYSLPPGETWLPPNATPVATSADPGPAIIAQSVAVTEPSIPITHKSQVPTPFDCEPRLGQPR